MRSFRRAKAPGDLRSMNSSMVPGRDIVSAWSCFVSAFELLLLRWLACNATVSLAMMDGLTFSARTVGVDKEQSGMSSCIQFLRSTTCFSFTNFMLKQLLTEPGSSCSTLSNSAVTVHHLALLYIGLYSLSTDMLSTCLLSDVFQIEGCLAGLDVGAMDTPAGQ